MFWVPGIFLPVQDGSSIANGPKVIIHAVDRAQPSRTIGNWDLHEMRRVRLLVDESLAVFLAVVLKDQPPRLIIWPRRSVAAVSVSVGLVTGFAVSQRRTPFSYRATFVARAGREQALAIPADPHALQRLRRIECHDPHLRVIERQDTPLFADGPTLP